MKIHSKIWNTGSSNSYLIETDEKNCAIVDPGSSGKDVISWIKSLHLTPKMILLTHGHYDHIDGIAGLIQTFPHLEIYIGKNEMKVVDWCIPYLKNPDSAIFIKEKAFEVGERDEVKLDELTFKVVTTPGHTSGSVVYICGKELFSGDTLFREEIGRCDLFSGNYETMLQTLKKLGNLSGDYNIYPGHEQSTTLQHEREHNHYMKQVL